MAIVKNPKTIDLSDVQGMVTRGYAKLIQTAYLMLDVKDPVKAREWISDIYPLIGCADHTKKWDKTLHLAFGPDGLQELGLHQDNIDSFPIPFREGMSTPNRNRILGDYGTNAPETWRWGHGKGEQILMIFHAKDEEAIAAFLAEEKERIAKNGGITIAFETSGYAPKDNKEAFGFRDGISQPVIKGSGRPGPDNDMIETGEFLLGYKNEHGLFPDTPLLEREQGDSTILPSDPEGTGKKDLGRNGSFMVFRQMEQHVEKFWKAMEKHTLNPDGTVNEEAKTRLASKCVGRWPSGASLVNYPDSDPGGVHVDDDFGYADTDPDGLKCPFGSHLRRNNPRDAFRFYDKKQSEKVTRRHRIIRRGRTYEIPKENGDKGEIGLQFICFNTNIELQFEFIQHAWANDSQSSQFSNDIDIIIGVQPEGDPDNKLGQFTIQNEPVNEFYDNWEQFVTIKGGAYYFFPSLTTIKYLTTLDK